MNISKIKIVTLTLSSLVFAWGSGVMADSLKAAVKVTERSSLDFPEGSCGGFSPTGVRWTAPEAMVVDIKGGAWRARAGREDAEAPAARKRAKRLR